MVDRSCSRLYRFPGGFTPQFGGNLIDYSFVSGLRGFTSGGFNWDASVNLGTSDVDQFIFDTVNASLGYDTPTQFNPGSYRQDDVDLNFDISYAATDVVHFAAGTEWRNEKFTIGAGGQPSWEIGPYAAQGQEDRAVSCRLGIQLGYQGRLVRRRVVVVCVPASAGSTRCDAGWPPAPTRQPYARSRPHHGCELGRVPDDPTH